MKLIKLVHWFLLCIASIGVVTLIAELPKIGEFMILGATAVELICTALVGKKPNAGTR
jgi:hypothetical protein